MSAGVCIDTEFYSQELLAKHRNRMGCGVYSYAKHPTTKLLCINALTFNNNFEKEEQFNLSIEDGYLTKDSKDLITNWINKNFLFVAHNANFERTTLGEQLPLLKTISWYCTASHAAYAGLPMSLGKCSLLLNLIEKKDIELGEKLINRLKEIPFSNESYKNIYNDKAYMRELNYYCSKDVSSTFELLIYLILNFPWPKIERNIYKLDQEINDRGFKIDYDRVLTYYTYCDLYKIRLNREMNKLTQGRITKVSSRKSLSEILTKNNIYVSDFKKKTIDKKLQEPLPALIEKLLLLKSSSTKTSYNKLESMLSHVDKNDYRIRGQYLYYGAHTGRWTSRGVQSQNLSKLIKKNNKLFLIQDFEKDIQKSFYSHHFLEEIAGQIRQLIIADKNKTLHIVDYSSIEPRLLFWFCESKQALLDLQEDIYLKMASDIYQEEILDKKDKRRHIGKTTILGLGYKMSLNKFINYLKSYNIKDIDEEFARIIIEKYKNRYPEVPLLWKELEYCAKTSTRLQITTKYKGLSYAYHKDVLLTKLPSNTILHYRHPLLYKEIGYTNPNLLFTNNYGNKSRLHGGILTENLIQRLARDVFCDGLLRLKENGFNIIMHTHDEIICEESDDRLEEMCNILRTPPSWLHSKTPVSIEVEGHLCDRYIK